MFETRFVRQLVLVQDAGAVDSRANSADRLHLQEVPAPLLPRQGGQIQIMSRVTFSVFLILSNLHRSKSHIVLR